MFVVRVPFTDTVMQTSVLSIFYGTENMSFFSFFIIIIHQHVYAESVCVVYSVHPDAFLTGCCYF